MAGRLGGRFKARAAAAALASKASARASAPPGAAEAAALVASAPKDSAKRPKSPHSWGSGSPAGSQRPAWGRKTTGDSGEQAARRVDSGAAAGSGNCAVS